MVRDEPFIFHGTLPKRIYVHLELKVPHRYYCTQAKPESYTLQLTITELNDSFTAKRVQFCTENGISAELNVFKWGSFVCFYGSN